MNRRGVLVVTLAVAGLAVWRFWPEGDAAVVKSRLEALRAAVNTSTADGIGSVARAANIGAFFTDDVVVDLGQGTAPIRGRLTLVGMAERLQPRTAAFRMDLDDVGVELSPDRGAADVTLTASFIRRNVSTGEESIDAREFALAMTRAGGSWQIARVTAIDTLR
jgi:hypothetical protein